MMKTTKYLSTAALLIMGTIIMSCSNSDDMPGDDQPKSHTVTVTTTISLDDGATTRALAEDGKKTFTAGDQIAVIYTNTSGKTVKATSAPIAEADIRSSKKLATFTVTLENPQSGTVEYVYPAAMAKDDGTIVSIDSQDGTLATLQSQFDYARWHGEMTVSGTDVTLPYILLANPLTCCKFTIKNSGGTDITSSITNLTISDGTNLYVVTRKAAAGPIYVVMQPVIGQNITLYAASNTNGFTKTTASSQTLYGSKLYEINVEMNSCDMGLAMQATPLSLEAKTSGTIKVTRPKSGMQYTKNGSVKTAVLPAEIPVSAGDVLQFYGARTSITGYGGTTDGASTKIESTADYYAYGNIMSLLDEKGFVTNTDFTASTDNYTFAFLFYNNTGNSHLYNHSHKTFELPATTLREGCYYYMFYGCTNLTKAPVLPAATLVKYCYANMFRGCSSLNYVKCSGNPVSSNTNYTSEWLSGVPSSGTFVKKSGVTTWWTGSGGIPSGWTVTEE